MEKGLPFLSRMGGCLQLLWKGEVPPKLKRAELGPLPFTRTERERETAALKRA